MKMCHHSTCTEGAKDTPETSEDEDDELWHEAAAQLQLEV